LLTADPNPQALPMVEHGKSFFKRISHRIGRIILDGPQLKRFLFFG
jgi:hypothetical protein